MHIWPTFHHPNSILKTTSSLKTWTAHNPYPTLHWKNEGPRFARALISTSRNKRTSWQNLEFLSFVHHGINIHHGKIRCRTSWMYVVLIKYGINVHHGLFWITHVRTSWNKHRTSWKLMNSTASVHVLLFDSTSAKFHNKLPSKWKIEIQVMMKLCSLSLACDGVLPRLGLRHHRGPQGAASRRRDFGHQCRLPGRPLIFASPEQDSSRHKGKKLSN